MKNYATTTNKYGMGNRQQNNNKTNLSEGRLKYNEQGGPVMSLISSLKHSDDLFLLEGLNNEEILRIDHKGNIYLKKLLVDMDNQNHNGKKQHNKFDEGIVIGNWKIVACGDELLIQKLIEGKWVNKQALQ